MLFATTLLAANLLKNPHFQIENRDSARDACLEQELRTQWPALNGASIYWTVPVPSSGKTTFDRVTYDFCVQDSARPDYCGTAYEMLLLPETKWEVDVEHSNFQEVFVRARGLQSVAPVNLRKTGAKALDLNLSNCREFFGAQ